MSEPFEDQDIVTENLIPSHQVGGENQFLGEDDARALVEQRLNGMVPEDCTEPIRNARGESIRLGF